MGIPFGQVAANLANAIADVHEQNRVESMQNQEFAQSQKERAARLFQGVQQMQLQRESAQRQQQAQQFNDAARKQQMDLAAQEFNLRKATMEQSGWQHTVAQDPKTGKWGTIATKTGEPSQFTPFPEGYVPEAVVEKGMTDLSKPAEIKSWGGFDWELTPADKVGKLNTKTMRPDPSGRGVWVQMGPTKAAGGADPVLDRWIAEQEYRMKHAGPQDVSRAESMLTRYRALSEQVAKAKVNPSLWASILQTTGVKDVGQMDAALAGMKEDVRAAYIRAGLPLPVDFEASGTSGGADSLSDIGGEKVQ